MNRSLPTFPLQFPQRCLNTIIHMPLAQWNRIGIALTAMSGVVVTGVLSTQWWYSFQVSQYLPVSGVLHVGSALVGLEVARTESEKQIGLMNRDHLAADQGMAFIFNPPTKAGFWMQRMRVPLDLLFLDAGSRIIALSESAPPCGWKCPVYYSPVPAAVVIELPAGSAKKFHLSVGQTVGLDVAQLKEQRVLGDKPPFPVD